MQIPETFVDARPHLVARAVGRTPLGIRTLRLSLDAPTAELDSIAPVAADVTVGLVLDLPDVDVPVTESTLRQWGMTLEQAIAESFAVHGSENPRVERVEGATVVSDRSYAAYLLRSPAAAARLAGGTPVVLVPNDACLVLGVAEDAGSLGVAAKVAERLVQEGRPVSASALIAEGDGWAPFGLPVSAEPAASDLRRRFSSLQYAAQRPLLQAFYDRSAQDYFVAEAMLVRDPRGAMQIVAALTEGLPTVLPWADQLSLVRDGAVLGHVSMPEVVASSEAIVALPDLDPPRWYATGFPAAFLR